MILNLGSNSSVASFFIDMKMDVEEIGKQSKDEELFHVNPVDDEESKRQLLKQQMLCEQQQRDIQVSVSCCFFFSSLESSLTLVNLYG